MSNKSNTFIFMTAKIKFIKKSNFNALQIFLIMAFPDLESLLRLVSFIEY